MGRITEYGLRWRSRLGIWPRAFLDWQIRYHRLRLNGGYDGPGVFIEVSRFHVFNFEAKGEEKHWLGYRYAAWVIPSVGQGEGRGRRPAARVARFMTVSAIASATSAPRASRRSTSAGSAASCA